MAATATNDGGLIPPAPRSRFDRKNRSLRARLITFFVLIAFLIIAAGTVAVWQFRLIPSVTQRLANADETSLAILRVHFDIDTFRNSVDLLAGSHDARQFTAEATSIRQRFLHDVDHAQQLLRDGFDAPGATISTTLESLRVALLSQLDMAVELANAGEWRLVGPRLTTQLPALMDYSSSMMDRVNQRLLELLTEGVEEKRRAQRRLIVIEAVLSLASFPGGFTASQLAHQVRILGKQRESEYGPRHAAYDLKKLQGKQMVEHVGKRRRYQPMLNSLRAMAALLVLRDKVVRPILAAAQPLRPSRGTQNSAPIDRHYETIRLAMQEIFHELGIAA